MRIRREIDFIVDHNQEPIFKIRLDGQFNHELCDYYKKNNNAQIWFDYKIIENMDMNGKLYYTIKLFTSYSEPFNIMTIEYEKVDENDDENDEGYDCSSRTVVWSNLQDCEKIYNTFRDMLSLELEKVKQSCLKYANHQEKDIKTERF